MVRLSLCGTLARAASAAEPIFAVASDAGLGCAASTACDVMSGAGAGVAISVCIAGRRGSGKPERWLVIITGDPGSSVASATNSNAISTKPATTKKLKTGIAAFRVHATQHAEQRPVPQNAGAEKGRAEGDLATRPTLDTRWEAPDWA